MINITSETLAGGNTGYIIGVWNHSGETCCALAWIAQIVRDRTADERSYVVQRDEPMQCSDGLWQSFTYIALESWQDAQRGELCATIPVDKPDEYGVYIHDDGERIHKFTKVGDGIYLLVRGGVILKQTTA